MYGFPAFHRYLVPTKHFFHEDLGAIFYRLTTGYIASGVQCNVFGIVWVYVFYKLFCLQKCRNRQQTGINKDTFRKDKVF